MRKYGCYFRLLFSDLTYNSLVFFTSFLLIMSINIIFIIANVCMSGFEQGIENVSNKLGADIVIVSDDYDKEMKDSLFLGTPSTFIFDKSKATESLQHIEGIKDCSSQLFLSSLEDSCCEDSIQFIVYESETDFLIQPWMNEYKEKNEKRDIIIGSDIDHEVGDVVTFFGCVFNVAGKLTQTGIGYDDCIFVNQKVGKSISNFLKIESYENQASMILINVDNEHHVDSVLDEINANLKGTKLIAYKSSELYGQVSADLKSIGYGIRAFLIIIYILGGYSLFAIISLGVSMKQKEFMSLQLIGIRNGLKSWIVVVEQVILALIASLTGIVLGCIILKVLKNQLMYFFSMPLVLGRNMLYVAVQSVLLSLLIVCIASMYSAYKVYRIK